MIGLPCELRSRDTNHAMPVIPFALEEFPAGAPAVNTVMEIDLSLDELFHAAITTGHGQDWRVVLGATLAGVFEMLWKSSALFMTSREENVARQANAAAVSRLIPTNRYWLLDPSEKRGASYHVGMLLATAWARRALLVPWLLHLDVYWQQLGILPFAPNAQRPDLVGWSHAGGFVVVECKGRAWAPGGPARAAAKAQAQRVINVAGQPPALQLAFFSFFGCDRESAGRRKARILKGLVVDPPEGGNVKHPIQLAELSAERLLELYYERLLPLFSLGETQIDQDRIVWREFRDLDFSLGIQEDVLTAVKRKRFMRIPGIVADIAASETMSARYAWVGDGLIVHAGERWHEQLRARR